MVNEEMAALWAIAQTGDHPSHGDIADEVALEPFVVPLPIEWTTRWERLLLLPPPLLRPGQMRRPRAACASQ